MAEGLSNSEIADIYAEMMGGDRSALFKLQQIASSPYQQKQSRAHKEGPSKPPTASQASRATVSESKAEEAFKEVSSVPAMPASKEQLYLNAIRQGAKFAATRTDKPRGQAKHFRIVNSSNEVYASENKDKTLFRDKQDKLAREAESVKPHQISAQLDKPRVASRPYALPRVPQKQRELPELAKAQSAHFEPGKREGEAGREGERQGLEQLEKSKIALKKERVDFKEIIGKNKKGREEFERKNEEEREVQNDILVYHHQTKDFLADVASRYGLNFNNRGRYLRRRKESPPGVQECQSEKKLSPFRAAMKGEGERCGEIEGEVAQLRALLGSNERRLRQAEREGEALLFARYLARYGMEIREEAEEEGDTVEPLEENPRDPNRYKYSMARTRERKWGLIQRTQYESQRAHSLGESRQANTTTRTSQEAEQGGQGANRVTVNERLKNLLFT